MEATLPVAYGYLLVLFRCTALVAVAPALSARTIPARVRIGVAAVLAGAAFLGAGAPAVDVPSSLGVLVLAAGHETLLGLLAGIGARWVLEAAAAAGHIAGLTMGLGYGAQLSPFTGADSPALAQLLSMIAMGSAVALGVHREAVLWLCRSLARQPPGVLGSLRDVGAQAIGQGIEGLGLGARVAFPIMVAVTSAHFALGLASRFAPQVNLQSVGFSLSLLAGGATLYLFGPSAAELVARAAVAALTH